MRKLVLPVAVVAVLLAAPAGAQAITIGSDSLGSPAGDTVQCGTYDPCVLIQDDIGGGLIRVPSGDWIVTSWRTRGASGSMALEVLQPTGGTSSSLEGTFKSESAEVLGAGGGSVQQFPTRLPASGGDMIGVAIDAAGGIGANAAGPGTTFYEAPPTANFTTNLSGTYELLLQATLEPDSDGDGFGDATQDGCSTSPSTQGACPQPPGPPDPLAALRAGKKPKVTISKSKVGAPKGVVAVVLNNPNGYRVKGRLTLTRKGRKVGSRSYSIAAGDQRAVKVKLSRKARRALKRAGKLKLKASATVKGPIGKRGSSKGSFTVVKSKLKAKRGGKRFKGRTKNINVQFSFDLDGNQMRNIVGGIVVTCFYPSGRNRSGVEVYDPPAPFPLGRKTEQFANDKPSAILGSKTRKRYTMDARRKGDKVTGTIQVSYAFVAYNPITGFAQGSSCVGQDDFTAYRR
ncbi:MAG: hypothetical protein QOH58_1135 [Thermoleophilaceae bacterium]|nr:hypothetical protein [Thermoleophilaceae bacterium]